jgi:hypothetical protein
MLDLGLETPPDPELTSEEMQQVAFAAKMAALKAIRRRPRHAAPDARTSLTKRPASVEDMRSDKIRLSEILLPEGWRSYWLGDRWMSIVAPNALATIDLQARQVRPGGNNTCGDFIRCKGGGLTYPHRGRGWVERLHADAVAWLREQGGGK